MDKIGELDYRVKLDDGRVKNLSHKYDEKDVKRGRIAAWYV